MDDKINHPVVKALAPSLVAWYSHATPNELASFVAACLGGVCSVLFITEWVYKRVYKPFAIKKKWIRGPHGFLESTGNAPFHDEVQKEPPHG